MESFNGDVEKFYPNFYKFFDDANHLLKGLDCNCTRLLRLEITDHMLGYITGDTCSNVAQLDYKFQPKINHLLRI